jgi:hypothetical protein
VRLGRVRLRRVRLGKTKRERHRLAAGKRLGRGGVHSPHGTAHAAARLSLIAEIPAVLEGLRAITVRHAGGLKAGFAVGYGCCWRRARRNRQSLGGASQRTLSHSTFSSSSDQVIRENPASRGTEISAEVLVVGLRSKDKNSRSLCRRERRPSYAHTAAPLGVGPREPRTRAALRAANPGVAATTGPSVDVSFLRSAFIIASTPCSCVGIGHQHSGIVRLFEASVTLTNPTYLTR